MYQQDIHYNYYDEKLSIPINILGKNLSLEILCIYPTNYLSNY